MHFLKPLLIWYFQGFFKETGKRQVCVDLKKLKSSFSFWFQTTQLSNSTLFFYSFIFETKNFVSVQCVEYLFVEFIIVPIFRIINNVIPDALVRFIITDDMVVKSGLPGKIKPHAIGMFGYRRFVRTNN